MSDILAEDDVREAFVAGAMVNGVAYNRDEARAWFDEWLEDHTRVMQARALVDASNELQVDLNLRSFQALRARAAELRGGRK